MTGSGLRKLGWHWTWKGWKRTPKRLLAVKKVPLPTKRKTRKKTGITPAVPREKLPTFAEARKLAAEQWRADSAPTPAPEAGKPQRPAKRGGRGAVNTTTSRNRPMASRRAVSYETFSMTENRPKPAFLFVIALCSTRRRPSIFLGTPFVPTPSEYHDAQKGIKAPPLGGGTGRFFRLRKNTGATF